jgi:hypothetical protein
MALDNDLRIEMFCCLFYPILVCIKSYTFLHLFIHAAFVNAVNITYSNF